MGDNENADLVQQYPRYVMRITGDDAEGKEQLGNFIDPEAKVPVIVTTSRLLSTGVDAQTCRLIVLEREVGSMTEFKQIVGRGTRVHEDTRKFYFTLIDFRKATNHFADPDFDGEPVQIYEPGEGDPVMPPELPADAQPGDDEALPPVPGPDEIIVDGYRRFKAGKSLSDVFKELPPQHGGRARGLGEAVRPAPLSRRARYQPHSRIESLSCRALFLCSSGLSALACISSRE